MVGCCGSGICEDDEGVLPPGWRRALIVALVLNLAMFGVEVGAGIEAGSASLRADALDFLGDAANYAISLGVAGLALRWRARAAFVKGATMFSFGLWVLGSTAWLAAGGVVPHAGIMGAVAILALATNAGVALLLFRFSGGDANMRSVWICSRNDAIGNIAVLAAAGLVFASGTFWPDFSVALIMALLALSGGGQVMLQSVGELRRAGRAKAAMHTTPVTMHR